MNKIIFLDVDGILNSHTWFVKTNATYDNLESHFDPEAVARLNQITDTTGAEIVISSSWRLLFVDRFKDFTDFLSKVGITGKIAGVTKITSGDRSEEIWDYIGSHSITEYLILDDDRLERKMDSSDPVLDMHFIKTTFMYGLQDKHIPMALEILGGSHRST